MEETSTQQISSQQNDLTSPLSPPTLPPTPPSFPIRKKGGGLLIKIIIIIMAIVVLAAVAAGSLLATRIWDPFWSPFRPKPEKVIADMFEKIKTIKSCHSELKINVDKKSPNPGKIEINYSGDNDFQNIKKEGVFRILFTIQHSNGLEEIVSGRFKIINPKEAYFNISEINAPSLMPFFTMMGIDFNNIIGNWIKIPIDDKFSQTANALITELAGKRRKIVFEDRFYIVKEQLPDQIIEGQKMYHYLVILENDKIAKIIGDSIAELMKQSNLNQSRVETGGLLVGGMFKGIISEFLNKIGEININLLIGKNDNFLYGLKMEKSIDLSKIDSNVQGLFDITIETNNSKFNQPVTIEAPTIFKTFEETFPPVPIIK